MRLAKAVDHSILTYIQQIVDPLAASFVGYHETSDGHIAILYRHKHDPGVKRHQFYAGFTTLINVIDLAVPEEGPW